jgi:hypothetical protein
VNGGGRGGETEHGILREDSSSLLLKLHVVQAYLGPRRGSVATVATVAETPRGADYPRLTH